LQQYFDAVITTHLGKRILKRALATASSDPSELLFGTEALVDDRTGLKGSE
jgi:hypothetical protein